MRTRALRQFTLCFPRNIVTIDLPFVTRFTKVRIAPAEPLRNRAAEFAFKFNEVSSVLRAVLNAGTYTNSGALTTNKVLRFVLLTLFLRSLAVFQTSKVR